LLVGPSFHNPFFWSHQKWGKIVKNDFLHLCNLFDSLTLNLSFNLPFTIFLSQSFFHNISLTIFLSQSFFHNISLTIFFPQSSFTSLFQSLQNVGRIFVRWWACSSAKHSISRYFSFHEDPAYKYISPT